MPKAKTFFQCSECGYETYKWLGRCPECQKWHTLIEKDSPIRDKGSGVADGEPRLLEEIGSFFQERFFTGINEFDRVLGGGVVPGSTVLVGGDPGIGKSTLLMQVVLRLSFEGYKVLYVSGEESLPQLKMRAVRLGFDGEPLWVLAETQYSAIADFIERYEPHVVIIDSIQTMAKSNVDNLPGSVAQVREVTTSLQQVAKNKHITLFFVGHVTKEGVIAGPRMLEHMVDCVLYFEGERYHSFRVLRCIKNRYGSTNEMGVFTMENHGLLEVDNPSALFLEQRSNPVAGVSVIPVMEGSRPLMVEIQSLVTPSYFGGPPRRNSAGLDHNRVSLIIAVLEKKAGMALPNQDIFVNAVGGVKIIEPAVDIGIAVSIASSFREKPLKQGTMLLGEVGLTGEIRPVSRVGERLNEGIKMGFTRCILPSGNLKREFSYSEAVSKNAELIAIEHLGDALEVAMD